MVARDRAPLCGAYVADVRQLRKKGTCQLLRVVLPAGMRGAHRGLRQLAAVVVAAKPALRATEAPAVVAVSPGARQGVPATVAARRGAVLLWDRARRAGPATIALSTHLAGWNGGTTASSRGHLRPGTSPDNGGGVAWADVRQLRNTIVNHQKLSKLGM